MFRYLKAAFFVRPTVPGLGAVPVNAILFGCLLILGFGHPGFWLVALGLETAFLASLATYPRYQRLVDALDASHGQDDAGAKRSDLVAQLIPPAQKRLADLEAKAARAVDLARKQGAEDYILDANQDALQKLTWLYLKLLLGRQYLSSQESQATEQVLRGRIGALQKELGGDDLAPTLRESKAETLKILQKRHENLERREQTLAEIDSDLTRIEAQIDLAVENATMSGQAQAVSSNITLVSHLLDPDLFGRSESTIADLDQAYAKPQQVKESA